MNRFKMVFNNSVGIHTPYNNMASNLSSLPRQMTPTPAKNMALNTPMIDRIHKAKPGCSACGKKVA